MELFGTAGIRGPAREKVTPALALSVGQAAGLDGAAFVVGRDGRETGPALAAAMEAGLESAGANVYRVGEVPTPALAYASRGKRGVMITASHNPPEDNGIKLFVDGVEYARDDEERIESRIADGTEPVAWDEWGEPEHVAVLKSYREAVADYAREVAGDGSGEPLSGMRIAVDCGTGMASVATPQVLRKLGARVVGVNANVDGHFPARESKPTPETLSEFSAFLAEASEETPFDLGIAHDGDADRMVVLDPTGDVVHEDTVLAMLASHYVAESSADDPVVVTTPNASGRIDERVDAAGGRVERVRLGALHEGIASARQSDGDVVFAGEPWKHIHTAFGGWIDGVASAAVVSALVAGAGDLATLREPISERPYRKVSVPCPDDAKADAMGRIRETLPAEFPEGDVDTEYGVRIDRPDGSWVLVRPSGTEPYVRIYAESETVDDLVDTARGIVEAAIESTTTG